MDDNVFDFVLLRIQSELDKYQKTKTLPHDLLEGAYTIDDIKNKYYQLLSPAHQKIADRLLEDYCQTMDKSLNSIKQALRKDYAAVMRNLETEKSEFMLPSVLSKYRAGINPVKALFYELRTVTRTFDHENEYHQWLLGLIADNHYNNMIVDALAIDIKRLEKIVSRYYLPMTRYTDSIPLELFHARQLIKDFRHYLGTFITAKHWDPES